MDEEQLNVYVALEQRYYKLLIMHLVVMTQREMCDCKSNEFAVDLVKKDISIYNLILFKNVHIFSKYLPMKRFSLVISCSYF